MQAADRLMLTALTAALERLEGNVTVEAKQRRPDDDQPSWTLFAAGEISGATFSIEVHGETLRRVVLDAANIADQLGVDVMADLSGVDDA